MSSATTRDQVIWGELAVVSVSFAMGLAFTNGLHGLMVGDKVYATLLVFLVPFWVLGVVANIRRLLRAIP